jgi:hypothetical protein
MTNELIEKNTVAKFHENEARACRTGIIVSMGPRFIGFISFDVPIKITKIDARRARITPIEYPAEKAKKALRIYGRKYGITKGARRKLRKT